jgi:hypothetical protein
VWEVLEPNRTVFGVQSWSAGRLPEPVANTSPGTQTQVSNVSQIKQINYHPAEYGENGAHASISHTKNWLDWNGDLDNQDASKDDQKEDNQSSIELDCGVEHSETPWK